MPNVVDSSQPHETPPTDVADVWIWTWFKQQADRFRYWIFGGTLLLYALGMNGQWLMTPDSAIHLNVATNLVEAHAYATSSGMQERVNPGLPWLLSTVFKIFGPEAIFQAKLVIMFMGLANLAAVFWLFVYTVDRPTAVVMTLLMALSENSYHYAFYLLTDTPFALGLTLFLTGFARCEKTGLKRPWITWLLMIAGAILMVAFRLVFVTFIAGFAAYLIIRAIRERMFLKKAIAIFIVLVVTLVVSCFADPRRSAESLMVFKEKQILYVVMENLSTFVKEGVFHRIPNELPRLTTRALFGVNLGNYPSIPFAIFAVVCAVCLIRRNLLWGCIVLAFLAQWILFFYDSRYFVAVQVLWVYAYLEGALFIARTLLVPERLPRWIYLMIYPTRILPLTYSDRTLLVFLTLFLLPNVIRIEQFISIQRSAEPLVRYEAGQFKNLPEMGRFINEHTPPDAIIVTEYDLFPEITTYLSKRKTISLLSWLANQTPMDKTYLLTPISPQGRDRVAALSLIKYPALAEFSRPRGMNPWMLHKLDEPIAPKK